MSTFEEIKARTEKRQLLGKSQGWELTQVDRDINALVEMVEALKDIAHPDPALIDKRPLVLYFKTEQDRDEMIAACKEALPNAREVKLP